MQRFIRRLWTTNASAARELADEPIPATPNADRGALLRSARRAIAKVSADLHRGFAFNTAIAAVMELLNGCTPEKRGAAEPGLVRSVLATANFAPHATTDAFHRTRRRRP